MSRPTPDQALYVELSSSDHLMSAPVEESTSADSSFVERSDTSSTRPSKPDAPAEFADEQFADIG